MRLFHEPGPDYSREALTFALGAAGGLALGLLLVRTFPMPQRAEGLGTRLRERARTVAGRLRPARLRRMGREQRELTGLEDAVLEAFFADAILGERGVDVGAISPGIVELSGSVWTEEEAERAVRLATGVSGVRTVVNRMEIEDDTRHLELARRRLDEEGGSLASIQHETSRVGGMGTRRQSSGTDPDRPDDSRDIGMSALRDADRGQWEDEGYASRTPRASKASWRARFDEEKVIPQDPHGKHAPVTLDSPPEELNSSARVGEGLKSAEHLALERSDVPEKPHGERTTKPDSGSAE
jgi:hypothetical protein